MSLQVKEPTLLLVTNTHPLLGQPVATVVAYAKEMAARHGSALLFGPRCEQCNIRT